MKINVSWRCGWTGSEWEAEMRGVFTVLSLLVVVAIIGVLAKKQMGSLAGPPALPVVPGAAVPAPGSPPATPKQVVQQFEQAVQGQMQQARPMPDDTK
jgi:hypothetical protein